MTRPTVRAAGLLLLVGLLSASAVVAQPPGGEPQKSVRELYVPFDALDALLGAGTERVFLTRQQYEELLSQATRDAELKPPREALLLSAEYAGQIHNGRIQITGLLRAEVLAGGLHTLPLDLSGVGVRSALLDGKPAALGRTSDGKLLLFLEGEKIHELQLELIAPVASSAAQQTLQMELPNPATARFRIVAPGDVDLRSGAAVSERVVDQNAETTRLDLVAPRGPLSLVLSLNNRQLIQQRSVLVRSVLVDEVTQAYERIHATVSLDVLHGAVEQFQFVLPEGFDVTDVKSPALAKWEVGAVENRPAPVLTVQLREPTTESVVLNVSAVSNRPTGQGWSFPQLTALDVVGQTAVVGLLVEEQLETDSIGHEQLIPIDVSMLRQALPETIFAAEPGAPRVRPVAAFYAPQADYRLSANFTKPPAKVDVTTNLVLTLDNRGQQIRGAFALVPQSETLFTIEITAPRDWHVTRVTGNGGEELPFARFPGIDPEVQRLLVQLAVGIAPGSELKLFLDAARTPQDWLADWQQTSVVFPAIAVTGAARDRGALAIVARDDLAVRPETLEQLTPLDEKEKAQFGLADTATTLAYRYETRPFAATIAVERTAPRIAARTYNFLRVSPEGLFAHYEIIYDVRQARVQRLSFTLPSSTPAAVAIRGLDAAAVKESASEIQDGDRTWTALLAEARQGVIRLAIDFQQTLSEQELQALSLPLVRAAGVDYQSAFVSVEGSPEYDIHIDTPARKVDVGELVDADYEVGRRLLGSYLLSDGLGEVWVQARHREGYGLPETLVQRSELVTLVSTFGRSQTAARFLLRSKASFLEVTLPEQAALWSVTVDGKPASPQRQQERLLVSLPAVTEGGLRDIQMVFEMPIRHVNWMGDIEAVAPRLVLRTDDGERTPVPMVDLEWHLILPPGQRLVRSSGTVFTRISPPKTSPWEIVAASLYELAGGVRPWYLLSVQRAQMAARQARMASPQFAADADLYFGEAETTAMPEAAPAPMTGMPGMGGIGGGEMAMPGMMGMGGMPAPKGPAQDLAAASDPFGVVQQAPVQLPREEEARVREQRPAVATGKPAAPRAAEVPAAGPAEGAGEAAQRVAAEKYWALQGVRSLPISLDETGEQVRFESLGADPRLHATLVSEASLRYLGWTLALVVGVIGLALTGRPLRTKAVYIIESLLVALILPLLVGWILQLEITDVFEPAFYAASLLIPYYLLAGCVKWLAQRLAGLRWRRPVAGAATLVVMLLASTACAQEAAPADWNKILEMLNPGPPIQLPADAVVIPYDPADPLGATSAAKVLVPYAKYVELWNAAFPEQALQARRPPAPYALAGATYQATLADEQDLLITGQMIIESFVDEAVTVPLGIAGGVLTQATLDGQPARLHIVEAAVSPAATEPQAAPQAARAAAAQPQSGSLIALQLSGKGRKQLELSLRMRLERSGGWRIARGRLPAAPSTRLDLTVPQAQTEVRLSEVPDRELHETTQPGERLETTLGREGQFVLQWRAKVAVGQIDERLTAQSSALFDVQEDGLRLTWQLALEFPGSQRDTFTLLVPAEYLLENVSGDNVRGWRVHPANGGQQVDVTLLKAVGDRASFTLHLARYGAIGQEGATTIAAPAARVSDAILHQGQVVIRRSPLLDVRTTQTTGLTRAAMDGEMLQALTSRVAVESPLGIRPFETWRFAALPYQLVLSAAAYPANVSADVQSLFKIGEREGSYETRVQLTVRDRPLYQVRLALPAGFRIDEVAFAGPHEWTAGDVEGRPAVTVYFPDGQQGTLSLIIRGALPVQPGVTPTPLPNLQALGASRQEGYTVVQADPAYDVIAEDLRNCESVPLRRAFEWLNEDQRRVARIAIYHRSPDYAAAIRSTVRRPRVSAFTITNVRVTLREVQQSVYLEYTIRDAGIREVTFLLPRTMETARITVPLLRQKTIEPVEGDPDRVRVRLELQDEVMDQLIVLVEHDHALRSGPQAAPIPTLENALTENRYVVLESEGRDEVVAASTQGLSPLNRQQSAWKRLSDLLQANITQAYLVADGDVAPVFTFETRQRAAVVTVGARVGLAQTFLVIDAQGTYRARQEYRVDNKTEQYLEVQLPEGAQLWTVRVAGEPVKPTTTQQRRHVLVPLLKTATGDLDYPVELKYGGRLPGLRTLRPIDFPLPRTININVELSQVRLYLPDTHYWFGFDGTLRQVKDEAELAAGFLQYRTKQIQSLTETLSFGANEFERMRSANNLKHLGLEMQNYRRGYAGRAEGLLQKEIASNSAAVSEAEQKLAEMVLDDSVSMQLDNRGRFLNRFQSQEVARSKGKVTQLGGNFDADADVDVAAPTTPADAENRFNADWFKGVEAGTKVQVADDKSRISAGRPLSQSQLQRRSSLAVGQELGRGEAEGRRSAEARDEQRQLGDLQREGQVQPSDQTQLQQRVERYQQKLEQQSAQQSYGDYALMPQRADAGGVVLWDEANGFGRASGRPLARGDISSLAFSADGRQLAAAAGDAPVQLAATGLASLDVEIPFRGREYLFTTPRGDIEITAHAAPAADVDRLFRLLQIAAIVVAAAVCFAVLRVLNRATSRRQKGLLLLLLGTVSLVTGIFPLAGLAVVITSLVLLFRRPRPALPDFRPVAEAP